MAMMWRLCLTALMCAPLLATRTPAIQGQNASTVERLEPAFREIDAAFDQWKARVRAPGAIMAVIVDGRIAWMKSSGVTDTGAKIVVTPESVFRIASMTKSFTALAILQLRDAGKLGLDDPVSRYVAELKELKYPTLDSPEVTIRHLLTHSEGFPEDNPWGDRQLAQPQDTMSAWMRQGIPFSTVPGTAYEYSNYGFAILGQIVERVAKQPYDRYVTKEILQPLGMADTTFEGSTIVPHRIAHGYRWDQQRWISEPELAHGSFGAMGGLWTSGRDLAKYVAFHAGAWPPRDTNDDGPLKRSSVREMHQAARMIPARVTRAAVQAPLELTAGAYGYGLRVTQTCRFRHVVSHGGGLPGYGSLMMWLPEYGVALIGMANVTYAGWSPLFATALSAMAATGALQPRPSVPSPALLQAKADVSRLIMKWDAELARTIAADNLFLDESMERREARFRALAATHGACTPDGTLDAENALRGTWSMRCERGRVDVAITLAPSQPPKVQFLDVTSVMPLNASMTAAIEAARPRIQRDAAAWGSCRIGDPVSGDGVTQSAVRLNCERGDLIAKLSMADGRLSQLELIPTGSCVP